MEKYNSGVVNTSDLIFAYIERSVKLLMRFKISFLFSIIALIVSVAIFFFINRVFSLSTTGVLWKYGGDYFSYVLIGLAVNYYASIAITEFLKTIRGCYLRNWLEIILTARSSLRSFFLSVLSWSYLYATFNVFLYFLFGIGIFGAALNFHNQWYIIILILFLAIISLSGIGLMSASMFMLSDAKGEVEPISWIILTLSGLVTGVYYPIGILPYPLQIVSQMLPQTHALEGIRLVILGGETIANTDVLYSILYLLIFACIYLPIGILMFKIGIKKAEKEGSLARWG